MSRLLVCLACLLAPGCATEDLTDREREIRKEEIEYQRVEAWREFMEFSKRCVEQGGVVVSRQYVVSRMGRGRAPDRYGCSPKRDVFGDF